MGLPPMDPVHRLLPCAGVPRLQQPQVSAPSTGAGRVDLRQVQMQICNTHDQPLPYSAPRRPSLHRGSGSPACSYYQPIDVLEGVRLRYDSSAAEQRRRRGAVYERLRFRPAQFWEPGVDTAWIAVQRAQSFAEDGSGRAMAKAPELSWCLVAP